MSKSNLQHYSLSNYTLSIKTFQIIPDLFKQIVPILSCSVVEHKLKHFLCFIFSFQSQNNSSWKSVTLSTHYFNIIFPDPPLPFLNYGWFLLMVLLLFLASFLWIFIFCVQHELKMNNRHKFEVIGCNNLVAADCWRYFCWQRTIFGRCCGFAANNTSNNKKPSCTITKSPKRKNNNINKIKEKIEKKRQQQRKN